MKTLYAKIALAFMLIVTLLVSAMLTFSYYSMQQYHEEITQKLNQPIAMYVGDKFTELRQQVGSEAAIEELANRAMTVNPTAEIYLLDDQGHILSSGLPADVRQLSSVDISLVQEFVSGNGHYPLRGDDPRHAQQQKVFSAFEVALADDKVGYIYVILGGKTFQTLADNILGSYVSKTALWGVLGLLFSSILAGLLVFSQLVRRLKSLTDAMRLFSTSPSENDTRNTNNNANRKGRNQVTIKDSLVTTSTVPVIPAIPKLSFQTNGDEIDQLSQAFTGMAGTIRQQMQKLEETDMLRRELISNVSHDLRTPLATTKGYLETMLIKQNQLNLDEQRNYLVNAQRSVNRLEQLINDLFELSKLESGQIKPELERFSILELIYDTVQEFSLEASQKNITINAPAPERDTFVNGDLGLIQRVLENLLKNALKYTPKNGLITLSYTVNNGKVNIAVEDNGYGIPKQDLPHIFDRFYRVNHRQDRHIQSTGLGLAIVKRILDLHSSKLNVTSQVNKGSCFSFDLDNGLFSG
jgi:signal transduction histidine kinase